MPETVQISSVSIPGVTQAQTALSQHSDPALRVSIINWQIKCSVIVREAQISGQLLVFDQQRTLPKTDMLASLVK